MFTHPLSNLHHALWRAWCRPHIRNEPFDFGFQGSIRQGDLLPGIVRRKNAHYAVNTPQGRDEIILGTAEVDFNDVMDALRLCCA